ncbi:hypothetical protein EZJ43_13300 [Pedobacter changchengzhani]|uniref:Outer membrane protein beta-barrel domain-containing protein n=1 Tax=Pedobacter changchengzhani TaxID=2529274 RepID=A0A4R5MJ89_9SPHI|nr:hypothetical protein [Pedobacter changchengzhani]TDG35592.1 hypothetical protein EZJ43_13300 [Pedobacter changchengzhani]
MKFAKTSTATLLLLYSLSNSLFAQDKRQEFKKSGVYFGVYTGTWFGTGNSSKLGNSIMGGLLLELKSEKSALGFNFDFFGNLGKTEKLYIMDDNQIIEKNSYSGVQISLQYSQEIYTKNRLALEAVGGVGYGDLSFSVPDKDNGVGKSSFFVDPGLGVRYFIGQETFLQFKLQYNLANYKLKDLASTNIGGNFVTTKLILGWR